MSVKKGNRKRRWKSYTANDLHIHFRGFFEHRLMRLGFLPLPGDWKPWKGVRG